jgi:hypothetical protein
MHLFSYLRPLGNISGQLFPFSILLLIKSSIGLLNYLTTKISSSRQKKFPLVSFVATPGLIDGAMAYPFDVEQALLWRGLSNCCQRK